MMNVGKEMEKKLISVGIESSEKLIEVGAKGAFLRLKQRDGLLSLLSYGGKPVAASNAN